MMNKTNKSDVKNNSQSWVYSDMVKDHFLNPRHFIEGSEPDWDYSGTGEVGSPACGDVMRMWIKITQNHHSKPNNNLSIKPKEARIEKVGWKTFGCASAIASTSVLAERLVADGGMSLEEAKKIKPKDIVGWLGGLPDNKIHCSVLGDQALREAIDDFERKVREK